MSVHLFDVIDVVEGFEGFDDLAVLFVLLELGAGHGEGDGEGDGEGSGEILGYAYCNWFKPRPAYRFSAEDSIYISDAARGQGLGRQLLDALCVAAEQAGVRRLLAVIGDSANAGSIGVHRAAGFSDVGIMRSTGWKFGKWLDIVLMDKPIGAGDTTSPE